MRVLLVEDDASVANALKQCLTGHQIGKFHVDTVASLGEAFARVLPTMYDIVLLDLNLPDCRGLATLQKFRETAPDLPVVVVSGINEDDTALQAIREGAQDFLVKGQFQSQELAQRVRLAYHRHSDSNLLQTIRQMSEQMAKLTAELKESREHAASLQKEIEGFDATTPILKRS